MTRLREQTGGEGFCYQPEEGDDLKGSKASLKPVFLIQALDTLEHLSLRD